MKKLLALTAALLWLGGANALAQDADHAWATPGGAIVNGAIGMCVNAAGQAIPAGPNCAGANSVGGFDTGSAPRVSVTTGSGAKSAGMAVGCVTVTCPGNQGAIFSIPVARVAGGSGLILQANWTSVGGDATGKMLKLWDVFPANTTCKDQTNFVSSVTDDAHLLTAPVAFTPAAPATTQGDTKTYASTSFLPPLSFKNQDSPTTNLVYGCVVSTASDTLDESAVVNLGLTAVQD